MEELLKQLGLVSGEAAVYQSLLERESGSPAELAAATKLKRPDTYNKLAELRAKGLVEEFTTSNGRKRYRLEHPQKLQDYLNQREQQLQTVERQLDSALPDLVSRYQLAAHKPGVSVFEGREGVLKVMDDSLAATTEILTYVDHDAVERYIPEENRAYVKRRNQLQKAKRLLVTYSAENERYFQTVTSDVTSVRFIDFPLPPISAVLQVYDRKLAYIVLKPSAMLGIIIDDPAISQLQRALFEYAWHTARRPSSSAEKKPGTLRE